MRFNISQFTALESHPDCLQFRTTASELGLAKGDYPEEFEIRPAVATGGPFYLMDVVDGQGWYTQGRGHMDRTAFVTVSPE